MKKVKLFIVAVFVTLSCATVSASSTDKVRVGLTNYQDMLSIYLKNTELYIAQNENMFNSEKVSSNTGFMLERNGTSIDVYVNNEFHKTYEDEIFIKPVSGNIIIGSRQYRGILEISSKMKLLNAVNILTMEDYLYGVVAMEIPHTWEIEAIKAQAVAARSFTYANMEVHSKNGYNLCDTVHCHAYNGATAEQESTSQAVNETKGVLAYHNNEIINAVYHSSSGGYTDNSENVWVDTLPYLRAVNDLHEENGREWERTFTFKELSNLTGVSNVNEVILRNSALTGRVLTVTFVGDNSKKEISKEDVRVFFSGSTDGSLLSTNFKFEGVEFEKYEEAEPEPPTQQEEFYDNKLNVMYVCTSEGISEISQKDLLSAFIVTKTGLTKNEDKYILSINNILNHIENSQIIEQQNIENKEKGITLEGGTYVTSVTKDTVENVVFVGSGWGHGLGLSQYGANSLAKLGYNYEEILKFYYTDISVS